MNNKLVLYVFMAVMLVMGVSAIGDVNIVESSVAISGNAGTTNSSQYINITNTGSSTLNGIVVNTTSFTGSSGTIPASALTFFLSSLNLPASTSYIDAIIFMIPSGQKAGTYTGTISATYNSSHYDSATVTATVNPVYNYNAAASSLTVTKGFFGTLAVNVTNTGNADITGMTYSVSQLVSGSNTLSTTSGSTGTLSVAYNSSGSISLMFSPTISQVAGTYSGSINTSYGGVNKTTTLTVVVKEPTYSISMPAVVYGESARNTNVTKSVTITNNGDLAITGITLTTNAPNTWITGTVPTTMNKADSFTVTLNSTVPNNVDSGLTKIGSLIFTSTQLNTSADIKTNAKVMLEFDSVKVSIKDSSWKTVNSGETADDDAKPGDTFGVKVKLENIFDDNEKTTDLTIENIVVDAVFRGAGESGDDIEGNTEDFDIDAGETGSELEIEFDEESIDWEANDGKLTMELTAEGEDEKGGKHKAIFNFTINVEREENGEFVFSRFEAPASARCGSTFTLYADGRSIGKNDDDEVVLRIQNSNLGIDIKETFSMGAYDGDECVALEEDDDNCKEFSLRQEIEVPSDISAGTYTITAKLYRDNENKQTDNDDLDIKIECGSSSSSGSSSSGSTSSGSTSSGSTTSSTSSGSTTGSTTSGSTTTGSKTTTSTTPASTTSTVAVLYSGGGVSTPTRGVVATSPTNIVDTTSKGGSGFSDSTEYLALLSILSVLAIVGIVVLLVYAFASPKA